MKKKILVVLMTSVLMGSLIGCNSGVETASEVTKGEGDTYEISVIIKATDSSYWQTVLMGAEAAAADSNGTIKVKTAGPASETGMAEQVTILENSILASPDAIVIASISSEAVVPAVEGAVEKGIPVVTIDNRLETDVYTQHLATDHYAASATAAENMIEDWKAAGIDPSGKKVAIISADSGSAVNQARCEGFGEKIKELVPDITVIETQYCENDIAKAQDTVDNLILANEDLVGLFGDNNHMGNGIANSIAQNGKAGSIIGYAFDSDDTEIAAIKDGVLTGIVVQDPYGMGYDGVLAAVEAIKGNEVEKNVIAATTLVTKANIENADVQKLLYPGK